MGWFLLLYYLCIQGSHNGTGAYGGKTLEPTIASDPMKSNIGKAFFNSLSGNTEGLEKSILRDDVPKAWQLCDNCSEKKEI